MELIVTNVNTAYTILINGNRKIKASRGNGMFVVEWINPNNNTFMFRTKKNSSLTANCEDYIFYITVPKNAKNIF
jgi:hypothetical protein